MLEFILERYNYWAIIILMMIGLYIAFQAGNMIKRLVGLSIFQTSVFLFYITLGKLAGGSAPILYGKDYPKDYSSKGEGYEKAPGAVRDTYPEPREEGFIDPLLPPGSGGEHLYEAYSNPLPHVLILTAIVVGVATLSVGLALVVRIREAYGTIENDEIREADLETATSDAEKEAA